MEDEIMGLFPIPLITKTIQELQGNGNLAANGKL
jgi:hypothetical protein